MKRLTTGPRFLFTTLLALSLVPLAGIAVVGVSPSWAVDPQADLDALEAKTALKEALHKMGKKDTERLEVREVLSCYPMTGSALNEFLCLLNMNSPQGGFKIERLPFRHLESNWEFIPPTGKYESVSAACPAKETAEKILKDSLRDSQLQVVSANDAGTFSDERGKNRDKKGPLRLMCSYITKSATGEKTVVTYFRYRKGEYLIDPDHETWTN